jgi:hypothetical protein
MSDLNPKNSVFGSGFALIGILITTPDSELVSALEMRIPDLNSAARENTASIK